jgi:baculoviral IAP repeat-containing protein 6
MTFSRLQDAAQRIEPYKALMKFIHVHGSHRASSEKTIFRERSFWPDNINLLALSVEQHTGREKKNTSSSLADCLRNFNIQSDMMLERSKRQQICLHQH